MTDLTLGDLSPSSGHGGGGGSGGSGGEAGGSDASTGEWIGELVERLDDQGYLGPILFGPENAMAMEGSAPQPVDGEGGGGGPDLDADTIADIGKTVIDQVGDVPVSQLVKFAEENPEKANMLIQQKLNQQEGAEDES